MTAKEDDEIIRRFEELQAQYETESVIDLKTMKCVYPPKAVMEQKRAIRKEERD